MLWRVWPSLWLYINRTQRGAFPVGPRTGHLGPKLGTSDRYYGAGNKWGPAPPSGISKSQSPGPTGPGPNHHRSLPPEAEEGTLAEWGKLSTVPAHPPQSRERWLPRESLAKITKKGDWHLPSTGICLTRGLARLPLTVLTRGEEEWREVTSRGKGEHGRSCTRSPQGGKRKRGGAEGATPGPRLDHITARGHRAP